MMCISVEISYLLQIKYRLQRVLSAIWVCALDGRSCTCKNKTKKKHKDESAHTVYLYEFITDKQVVHNVSMCVAENERMKRPLWESM